MVTNDGTPDKADQLRFDGMPDHVPLDVHDRDHELPSRIVFKPGDLVPIHRSRDPRRREADEVDRTLRASEGLRGYVQSRGTTVWMVNSPGELAAVKRALKRD